MFFTLPRLHTCFSFIHSFVHSFISGFVTAASPALWISGRGWEGARVGETAAGVHLVGRVGGEGPRWRAFWVALSNTRRAMRRGRGGGASRGSKLFSEPRRRGQPPGCASLSLPGRRRVPARSPGLGGQEGKFDQAVGEERDTLLGDAGNLQPVLQYVEFHRPPALRGSSSAGGEPRPPPPARPAGTKRRGQPAR